jgi:hypothetical protein
MNAELIAEILDRGKDDWIDFAEVMSIVRSRTALSEPVATTLSVELVGEMLNRRLALVGDLTERTGSVVFSPWDGLPKQNVERMQNALTKLGHRPGIGDVCWLSTT